MALHVLGCLKQVSSIQEISVLSSARPSELSAHWIEDAGAGLNTELALLRKRHSTSFLLVIHADLPLLRADDVRALLIAAKVSGNAIAPDRHGTGTNALALGPRKHFSFSFGPGSFQAHLAALEDCAEVVRREGLEFDLDTPDDLKILSQRGAEICCNLQF